MSEEIDVLKDVTQRLDKIGIQYMMTGSMAFALYSIPRMTRDIDIIINMFEGDVSKIIEIFQEDYYIDAVSVRQAIRYKSIFNIIHNESIIKVDFIIRKDTDYRIEEFSRRRAIDLDGKPLSVVTPEDLILSKLVWAKKGESELQFRDVVNMLKSMVTIDYAYMELWANKLGVSELLRKADAHE